MFIAYRCPSGYHRIHPDYPALLLVFFFLLTRRTFIAEEFKNDPRNRNAKPVAH